MIARFEDVNCRADGSRLIVTFRFEPPARAEPDFCMGWQLYDPSTGMFLAEGEWLDAAAGNQQLAIDLPLEAGDYHVYLSARDGRTGWHFLSHYPFVLAEAAVHGGSIRSAQAAVTTLGRVRRRNWPRKLRTLLTEPFHAITGNGALIRSMVRRELTARYRGSMGDVLWTILHPLLLMVTYVFVFGVVLRARFGGDPSQLGFVLYFLAGMLPWLAFSEAVGRSASVIIEHRNFVKKLVFPLETLPINLVLAGLITEAFAILIFLLFLIGSRGGVPGTLGWLPVLIALQFLLTLGVCWLLAAVGVYFRDLGQITGFALTLLFFLTPIGYPEASLPEWARQVLSGSPVYALVAGYRAVLLEHSAPTTGLLVRLGAESVTVFLFGYALFRRLRPSFADII